MNITSPNHSLHRTPLGYDPMGGSTATTGKNPVPRTTPFPTSRRGADPVEVHRTRVGDAATVGTTSHQARLLRLPNNRLSELHALLTYNGTAMAATLPRGVNIDLYA